MSAPEDDVEAWFRQYFKVFSTLDLAATLSHYHSPMLLVIPGGAISMQDATEVRTTFEMIFAQYAASGYERSEVVELASRHLGEGLAEVGGKGMRFDSSGAEMNSFLFRYVLRKDLGTWKIAAMINGDPIPPE